MAMHRFRLDRALSAATYLSLVAACSAATGPKPGDVSGDWKVPGPSSVAPAFDDSTVFFTTPSRDLVAVSKQDGSIRWRTATGANPLADETSQALFQENGIVVYGNFDLFAFDARTGQAKWTVRRPSSTGPGFWTFASANGVLFAGSQAGKAYAIGLADGSVKWEVNLATDTSITRLWYPVAANGRVFFGLHRSTYPVTGGMVALDATTGALLWGREFTPPAFPGGTACSSSMATFGSLVICGSRDTRVYALDQATGAIAWSTTRPSFETASDDGRPTTVVGGVVVVGSFSNATQGIDAATGTVLWTKTHQLGSTLEHLTNDGRFAFCDYGGSGNVAAIEPATGTFHFVRGPDNAEVMVSAAVSDGTRMYVAGAKYFWAFRLP